MKKYSFLSLLVIFIVFSCASKKKVAADDMVRDGSTFEKAIIINEAHEGAGVKDEYAWVRSSYPNSKMRSQALTYHGKIPYDILNITTEDGKAISVYFDISKFYGHF